MCIRDSIAKIDAIDEETAKELINRSKETLVKEKEAVALKLKELGVEEKLISLNFIDLDLCRLKPNFEELMRINK